MDGIFTGIGIFFKFKNSILIKSASKDDLNKLYGNELARNVASIEGNYMAPQVVHSVQHVVPSAPPLREIKITTE
jgi:hypothetical protein